MSFNRDSYEDPAVSRALSSLPRVEAPADLEFGIRRRIAAGRPSRALKRFALAGAAAALLMIPAVPAVYVLYGGSDETAQAPAAEIVNETAADTGPQVIGGTDARQQLPPGESALSAPPVRSGSSDAVTSRDQIATAATPILPGRSVRDPSETSIDRSISPVREPILPKGLSTRDSNNAALPKERVRVPIREVLEMIGIEAEFANGVWVAKSVRANGLAERSGVMPRDAIISIDDKMLNADAAFDAGSSGRKLTIRRGGESIAIELKNR